MSFQKIDNVQFKEIKETEEIYDAKQVARRKKVAENKIQELQAEIVECDRLLAEAVKLGIVSAEPIEVIK